MKTSFVAIILCSLGFTTAVPSQAQTGTANSELVAMQKARDHADVAALRTAIDAAKQAAQQKNTAGAYEQVARLDAWLCEAGHGQNDDKLVKMGCGRIAARFQCNEFPTSGDKEAAEDSNLALDRAVPARSLAALDRRV